MPERMLLPVAGALVLLLLTAGWGCRGTQKLSSARGHGPNTVDGEDKYCVPRQQGAPPAEQAKPSITRIDFEGDPVDAPPSGFTFALTGRGRPGDWKVLAKPDAPSGGNVLAQLGDDRTGRRYPVAIHETTSARDVRASVRIKPISGTKDQAGGIVLRYQDEGNYYVVRTNALENNIQFHLTKDGVRRHEFTARPVQIGRGKWHMLAVELVGDVFKVYVDGRFVGPEAREGSITDGGRVGLWTKADSVTWFDDLVIDSLDDE